MKDKAVITPLPPKVIVPALEAASLEASDSPLIDWWANLLVSGATGVFIRPYLIDLMKAIGPEEASLLDEIWKKFSRVSGYHSLSVDVGMSISLRMDEECTAYLQKWRGAHFTLEDSVGFLGQIGRHLVGTVEANGGIVNIEISYADKLVLIERSSLYEKRVAIEVCSALYLLQRRRHGLNPNFEQFEISVPPNVGSLFSIDVFYPSKLGAEFLSVCHPMPPPVAGSGIDPGYVRWPNTS